MEFDLFHLSFLLEVDYVFICLCVFFCLKLPSFISVGNLFVVVALLRFKQRNFSFVLSSKQSGIKRIQIKQQKINGNVSGIECFFHMAVQIHVAPQY